MTKLRNLHRVIAMILAAFVAAHLGNHVLIFAGADWHIRGMDALRIVYRNPVVEPILIAGFAVQIVIGLRLLWQRGWPQRFWPRLQVLSGGVLALFLIQHISATLLARATIDTNIYFAAAVVSRAPYVWYFAPYYTLGVAALFAHIAVLLHRHPKRRPWAWPVLAAGLTLGVALVAAMMAIDLPPAYDAHIGDGLL